MGDPERYRAKEEVKKWEEEDPIGIYRKYLIENKVATEKQLDKQDDEGEAVVEEAVAFAEASPNPGPDALFENIYVEETPIEYRGFAFEHESEGR